MRVQNILAFLCGGTVGTLISYWILQDRFEVEVEMEIEETREYYEKMLANYEIVAKDDVEEVASVETFETVGESIAKGLQDGMKDFTRQERHDYTRYFDPRIEVTNEPTSRTKPKGSIYAISDEEYVRDPKFEKVSINYYDKNEVYTDENDEPIYPDDSDNGIRYSWVLDYTMPWGAMCDDEDLAYIRNENISTDFEIVRIHEAYSGGD